MVFIWDFIDFSDHPSWAIRGEPPKRKGCIIRKHQLSLRPSFCTAATSTSFCQVSKIAMAQGQSLGGPIAVLRNLFQGWQSSGLRQALWAGGWWLRWISEVVRWYEFRFLGWFKRKFCWLHGWLKSLNLFGWRGQSRPPWHAAKMENTWWKSLASKLSR